MTLPSTIEEKTNTRGIRRGDGEYESVHSWLRYHYGSPAICEATDCLKISTRYDWALKKGKEYDRSRDNFLRLCRKCHSIYDKQGIPRTTAAKRRISAGRRASSFIRPVTFNGQTKSVAEWAEELGIKYGTLWRRLYLSKMTFTDALTQPIGYYDAIRNTRKH